MNQYSKFDWNREPARLTLRGGTAAMASEFFNRADMDGRGIYSSQSGMAERIGYSISTVRRAEAELIEKGLARRIVKGSDFGRGGNASQWILTIPGTVFTGDLSLQEQCSFLTGTVSIGDKNSVHQWSTNIPVNRPVNRSVSGSDDLEDHPPMETNGAAVRAAAYLPSDVSIDQETVFTDEQCSYTPLDDLIEAINESPDRWVRKKISAEVMGVDLQTAAAIIIPAITAGVLIEKQLESGMEVLMLP